MDAVFSALKEVAPELRIQEVIRQPPGNPEKLRHAYEWQNYPLMISLRLLKGHGSSDIDPVAARE